MAALLYAIVAMCAVARAAPPPQYFTHMQLQQGNPLDYYLNTNNAESVGYYNQQQKQSNYASANSDTSSRLENIDPDSEVELLPGAQLPQQPPQQTPVAPNIPGLIPGQRVFIVHMPVPGYRPGTLGGYQPVYIVAAAPQGNTAYPVSPDTAGYNAVLLGPGGAPQALYPRPQAAPNAFHFAYQDPYRAVLGAQPGAVNQFVLQSQPQTAEMAEQKSNEQSSSEQKSSKQVKILVESKDEEATRNARPSPNQRN